MTMVIGEKINAARKSVYKAITGRDEAFLAALARDQDLAGAEVIDLNAGTGLGNAGQAAEDMRWLVRVAQEATKKTLCVDSEIPEVLEAGLGAVSRGPAWINSVSAERLRLERVLPLAEAHGAVLVALCMGDDGIPKDAAGRMKAAETVYRKATDAGIEPGRLYFDPLVMPIGAEGGAGAIVLECLRLIKRELPGAGTVLGLSNVGFGLPARRVLNRAFLALSMGAGLDAAILDPTDGDLMTELYAADALLGKDAHCGRYIREFRKRNTKGGKP